MVVEEEVDELEDDDEDLPSVEVLGAARVVAGLRKRLRSVSRELAGALEREEQEQDKEQEEAAPAPRPSKKQKRKKEKRVVEEPEVRSVIPRSTRASSLHRL